MIFRENGRSVLPVKVSVDNVHSGGGQNRAGVSLFQYQSYGDLRLVIGCEGYEQSNTPPTIPPVSLLFRVVPVFAPAETTQFWKGPATEPPLVV